MDHDATNVDGLVQVERGREREYVAFGGQTSGREGFQNKTPKTESEQHLGESGSSPFGLVPWGIYWTKTINVIPKFHKPN